MIGQIKTLLRVKELKEQQAFRVVNAKRAELAEAEAAVVQAREIVERSAETLEARCDAEFDAILRRDIDIVDIDQVKGKVLEIEKAHEKLADALERAAHIRARVANELDQAIAAHRKSLRMRDKYILVKDDMVREHEAFITLREETETEDMVSMRRRAS